MGKVCIVLGCRNRDSYKQPGIKFNRIPKDEGRKELWIRAINRRDPVTGKVWISGDEGARVCSVHFIDGKCDDPKSPDYVPSVKMGYGSCGDNAGSSSKSVDRYKRAVKRTADQKERECRMQLDFLMTADGKENDHLPLQDLDCNVELEDKNGTGEFENYRILFETAISENTILIDRLQQLQFENNVIKNKPPYIRATSLSLEKTEETTKFYTGLPSYSYFMWLVNFVTCIIPSSNILSSADIRLLVLMKLRLNSPHTDISFRFGVSLSLVTNLIDSVIPQLAHKLKWLIHWPNKDDILRSRPDCFKEAFPRCVSVIDCTEVYIETPSNFTARSSTYSNYKHHNTIKFLVSIVPCGSISFVSRAFGGGGGGLQIR